MARRIESHMIPGPAGLLEALLEEPEIQTPREAALVCHPHPLHGGAMWNKVVHRLARGLRRSGAVVFRFNFRGVSRSQGVHDHGDGEVEDAHAALAWLRGRYPDLPVILAGFSFGSFVTLRLCATVPEVGRVIAAGFPIVYRERVAWETCRALKIFIHSTRDEHGPRDRMAELFEELPEPKQLHWVEARDHFFSGALAEFEETVLRLENVG